MVLKLVKTCQNLSKLVKKGIWCLVYGAKNVFPFLAPYGAKTEPVLAPYGAKNGNTFLAPYGAF